MLGCANEGRGTHRPAGDDGRPIDALALPRLSTGFTVATAVHCQLEPTRRADGGEDLVLTEGRATEITALLTALRLPDDTSTVGICTAEMPWVPNLLLLDAQGRWIRPGLPVDGCRKPRPEVPEAVRGLRLTIVSEEVVREIVSAGAAASGCNQDWSDVLRDAVVTGDAIYVELDHCRRVLATPLYGPAALAQADTAFVELLRK